MWNTKFVTLYRFISTTKKSNSPKFKDWSKKGETPAQGKLCKLFLKLLLSSHLLGEGLAFQLNCCVCVWNAVISLKCGSRIVITAFWVSLFEVWECVKTTTHFNPIYLILFEKRVVTTRKRIPIPNSKRHPIPPTQFKYFIGSFFTS